MLYNAMMVADYMIDRCRELKKPVSNLKLQKMLYFAWIDYHIQEGRALFLDEFCAWQFGPVIPAVYYEYCIYGGRPINIKCQLEIDDVDTQVLNEIVDRYVDVDVNVLVEKTHRSGTPWDRIYQHGAGNRRVIPFYLIEQLECGGQYVS